MSRIALVLDLDAEAIVWDPHEAIEDVLARGDKLPTFEPGMPFILPVGGSYGTDTVGGTFVAAEWVPDDFVPNGPPRCSGTGPLHERAAKITEWLRDPIGESGGITDVPAESGGVVSALFIEELLELIDHMAKIPGQHRDRFLADVVGDDEYPERGTPQRIRVDSVRDVCDILNHKLRDAIRKA